MKNILIIQGGGRPKGNTAQLVEHFIKGSEEAGHKVELISLLKNEVKVALAVMSVGMENHVSRMILLMKSFLKSKKRIVLSLHHHYTFGLFQPE